MSNPHGSLDPFINEGNSQDRESLSISGVLKHPGANNSIVSQISNTTKTSPRLRRSLMDRITRAAQDTTRNLRISGLNGFRASHSSLQEGDSSRTLDRVEDKFLQDGLTAPVASSPTSHGDENGNNADEMKPTNSEKIHESVRELKTRSLDLASPRITKRVHSGRPDAMHNLKDPSPSLKPADKPENDAAQHHIAPMKRPRNMLPHDEQDYDSLRTERGHSPVGKSGALRTGEIEAITAKLISELNARDSEILTLQAAVTEARRNNFSAIEQLRTQLAEMHEHMRNVLLTESPGGVKDLQTLLNRERAVRQSLEKSLKEQLEEFTISQTKAHQESQIITDRLLAEAKLAQSRQEQAEKQAESLRDELQRANSMINTQKQAADYQSRRIAQLEKELSREQAEKAELIKACNDYLQIE